MEEKRNLSGKEKFAYGIGAVGKDMVYMLSASYILYYYQDIMGIKAWIMGIILLAARVFDAFNDPIMGVLVAKTKTRWGKFRPWLLIGTVTNAVTLYFMFAAPPELNGKGLVTYAAVTYILWGVTYTMMDIPYWSMVPAFTEGGKERENLSALARSCAGVGSALISIVTVGVVAFLGNMFLSKDAVSLTNNISSSNTVVEVHVMERDGDKLPTGNVISFVDDNAVVDLTLTGPEKVFAEKIFFSNENAKFEVKLNDTVFNDKEMCSFNVAKDILDEDGNAVDSKAVVAIYVDSDVYNTITADSVSLTGTLDSTAAVERVGFKYFSLVIAVLFIIFILITCIVIKEKSTVDVQTARVGDMFRSLVRNDQAMAMVITIVLINTATYVTSNLLIYFFKYDLAGRNWRGDYMFFNMFGGGIQILAMMLLFPFLRKFMDTIKIFYVCTASAIVGYIILLFMALSGASNVMAFLVPGFFIMASSGLLNVLVTVFLANTVDYGELKNDRRDESVIFSMQTFVVKLSSGISALIASLVLSIFKIAEESSNIEGSAVDYVLTNVNNIKENFIETISNSSVIGLRISMTVLPITLLFIGVLVFANKYILTDSKLNEISAALAKRHSEE